MFGLGFPLLEIPFALLLAQPEVLPTPREELLWAEVLPENGKYFLLHTQMGNRTENGLKKDWFFGKYFLCLNQSWAGWGPEWPG